MVVQEIFWFSGKFAGWRILLTSGLNMSEGTDGEFAGWRICCEQLNFLCLYDF